MKHIFIDQSLLQNTMFFYDPKNPQPSNVLTVLIKHVFMQQAVREFSVLQNKTKAFESQPVFHRNVWQDP